MNPAIAFKFFHTRVASEEDPDPPPPPTGQSAFSSDAPTGFAVDNDSAYALGFRFSVTAAGKITHARWYGVDSGATTHVVRLWNATAGTVLSGPHTASVEGVGWKTFALPAQVSVSTGTQYMIVVNNSSQTNAYPAYGAFYSSPGNNGLNITWQAGAGSFGTNLTAMPEGVFNGGGYFRDIIYVPD